MKIFKTLAVCTALIVVGGLSILAVKQQTNRGLQVGQGGVPVGTIVAMYVPLDTGKIHHYPEIETGWLICDGSDIPKGSEYDKFRITCESVGLGYTTPDLRGMFLRGTDSTFRGRRNYDPEFGSRRGFGQKIGSSQMDTFERHNHNVTLDSKAYEGCAEGKYPAGVDGGCGDRPDYTITSTDAGGSETRPKNVYVNWIIKAY